MSRGGLDSSAPIPKSCAPGRRQSTPWYDSYEEFTSLAETRLAQNSFNYLK